jgi:signal transduction histidine kinase/CheY-like chemotaxis protein
MHAVAPGIRKRHRQQWLVLALCFSALVAGIAFWLSLQRERLLDEEGERLQGQVRVIERNLARQLLSTHQTLAQLNQEMLRRQTAGQPAHANAWMRSLTEIHIGVRTLLVLDERGRVLASNRDELVGRDFGQRAYFQAAVRANDPALLILSPPFETALGVMAMNAARVTHDATGRISGVVAATLDPDYIALLLSSVNYAGDVWSALAHGGGALVMFSPPRSDLVGRNLDQPGSMFRRHRESGHEASLFRGTIAATGDRRLIAHLNVRAPGVASDQFLVAAVSRSEAGVLAVWQSQALGATGMSLLLLLLAGAGVYWMQRAERATAEGLDRLERISQTAPGVICQFVMHPDGHASMPFATRPLQPYFGVAVSTVPGSADAMFQHIDPAHVEAMRNDILESARTLQPYRHEFRMRVPGEPERWLDVHSVPQQREDGSTIWTGLVMDTTETHNAREAQLALDTAQRSSRAKSEFLSRASHELRTPLNAVIGFSQLLLSHPSDGLNRSQREQLGYIHDAGLHLLALINDLLDVSAIESGHVTAVIEDVPVAALLAEVLSTVREQASAAGVQLHSRITTPRLVARADRLRLKQVLLNLLSNAVKYNHRGGSVTVAVEGAAGAEVRIEVQDTGLGLSGEQRAHLFEPFNRLGADQRGIAGTGIGLTIAKMLVELMHGRLSVDSTPGQGSRFGVHLPASAHTAAADPALSGHGLIELPPPPPGALRLLCVEDNPMNALFLTELLALRPRVRVTVAASGAEALDAVRRSPPDLLLVDLHLGDMSGFDLLQRLRADPATAALRCVALTADALPATRERALAAGFSDFVTKPVDIRALLALIDGAMPVNPA